MTVIGIVLILVWLVGVGLIAHALPKALMEDEDGAFLIDRAPERVSLIMAMVIVSWPLSAPALAIMAKRRMKG